VLVEKHGWGVVMVPSVEEYGRIFAACPLCENLNFRTKKLTLKLLIIFCAKDMHKNLEQAMAIFGYARVSTDGQTLAAQDASLRAAGCAKVYSEKASGAKTDRAELRKVVSRLNEGDILMVTRLDRLARSTRDLLNILDDTTLDPSTLAHRVDAAPAGLFQKAYFTDSPALRPAACSS
jgi:hypothetical protein